MNIVQKIHSIMEIQEAFKQALENNVYFQAAKIQVVPENAAQIDFIIKNALGKLGVICVIQTPAFDYIGKDDDGHPVWEMPEASIVISEIPTVNRSRAGASTALDAALQAAESINELGDAVALEQIRQVENQGVVSVFVTFKTSARFGYAKELTQPNSHFILTNGIDVEFAGDTINEGTIDAYIKQQGYPAGRDAVKEIVLGSKVTTLGHHAFAAFNELVSADISQATSVTTLAARTMQYDPKLTHVNLGSTLVEIGDTNFQQSFALKELTIPASVTTIGSWALANGGIEKVIFTGKTKAQVQAMTNYPWRMTGKTFVATDATWTA